MDLDRPPRRNLSRFKGLDAGVAVEVQEFVTLVEAHVYIMHRQIRCRSAAPPASKYGTVDLQRRFGVEGARTETAGPLRRGLIG